ncbi:MAG TPA: TetR/AcrR family transcriptional regulator, partial [Anaerovoracaceae bacterium]|nr:TetR/AcrR family transcriptional regulator [Anaerovoracaceae bacterium]
MNQADLRVVRSKKLIREAFIDLIEEKGYKNITIKEISKKAMVNRKTFYNHYDSVDALFADILRTTMDLLLEDLRYKDLRTNYPSSSEDIYGEIRILLHNLSNNKR